MSLQDRFFFTHDIAAIGGTEQDHLPLVDDRRDRLLEAGCLHGCAEGDFLALMPSVDARPGWTDDQTWLRRILGF